MKPQKATFEQLRRHNRQLLLRAVYSGLADNRAALAQATGLAKPTVSNLIAELLAEGLLVEGGHGPSTESGGKRPRLIEFLPDARQVIGVSVDQTRVLGVLSNLAGEITALHTAGLAGAPDAQTVIAGVVDGLSAQLDAPLLCLGLGVPGAVDTQAGTVRRSEQLGWHNLELAAQFSARYRVPAYVGNSAELCALAQFAFGGNGETNPRSLVTVLVNAGVEVGVTLEQGAIHYGGDVSCLQVAGADPQRLDGLLSWEATRRRLPALRRAHPATALPKEGLSYMHIRYAAAQGDAAALELVDELASSLAKVAAWVVGLLQPEHVSLAGPLVDLGEPLVEGVAAKTRELLSPELMESVSFSLAYSDNLGAMGAVALALQKELAIL